MRRMKRVAVGIGVAAAIGLQMLAAGVALAHNAGHIRLPSGECMNVGGGNSARNEEQDKYPDTPFPEKDEFGARWAADKGNTPIMPGHKAYCK